MLISPNGTKFNISIDDNGIFDLFTASNSQYKLKNLIDFDVTQDSKVKFEGKKNAYILFNVVFDVFCDEC